MQLVVIVESGAGVLELDLSVENDVRGDCICRKQNQAPGIDFVRAVNKAAISPYDHAQNRSAQPATLTPAANATQTVARP
jgi:hypothetical protein